MRRRLSAGPCSPWLHRILLAVLLAGSLAAGRLAAADDPPTKAISPDAAAEHVGQSCVVEMHVRSSRRGDTPICFLNSETDYRDKKNFTIVIFDQGLAKFKKSGVAEPDKHFEGKKLRVTGKVENYRGRPQIRVDEPEQIEIVKEPTNGQQTKE